MKTTTLLITAVLLVSTALADENGVRVADSGQTGLLLGMGLVSLVLLGRKFLKK